MVHNSFKFWKFFKFGVIDFSILAHDVIELIFLLRSSFDHILNIRKLGLVDHSWLLRLFIKWLVFRILFIISLHVHWWNSIWPFILSMQLLVLPVIFKNLSWFLNLIFFICLLSHTVNLFISVCLSVFLLPVNFSFSYFVHQYATDSSSFLLRGVVIFEKLVDELFFDFHIPLLVLKIRFGSSLSLNIWDVFLCLFWI